MRTVTTPALLLAAGAIFTLAGCKSINQPVLARPDAQLAGDIQSKLSADKAFSSPDSPDLQVAVANGVATLTGVATDDNSRLEAGTDASQVPGVKQVVNDLTLPAPEVADSCLPPAPVHHASMQVRRHHEPLPELASNYVPPAPAPAPVAPPPPPPPAPTYIAPPPAVVVPPAPVVVPPAVGVVVPVRPLYYGYARPYVGIGIYGRPGYVRPGYVRPGFGRPVRPYGFYRGGGRNFRR